MGIPVKRVSDFGQNNLYLQSIDWVQVQLKTKTTKQLLQKLRHYSHATMEQITFIAIAALAATTIVAVHIILGIRKYNNFAKKKRKDIVINNVEKDITTPKNKE